MKNINNTSESAYIMGMNNKATGGNAQIAAYGKFYNNFKELEYDHDLIKKFGGIAYIAIINKNEENDI